MGNAPIAVHGSNVHVIAPASTWIEGDALRQLDGTAQLPGMIEAVGMPDLHPGKGSPIGAAFLSRGVIRTALVGSDIGCSMALSQTDLPLRRADPDKLARRCERLDIPWDGDVRAWLEDFGLLPGPFDASLGTIGSGNHFAEIHSVVEIRDGAALERLGIDPAKDARRAKDARLRQRRGAREAKRSAEGGGLR